MTENKRFTVFQDSYDTIYIKDKDIYRGDGLRIGDEEYVKFENVLKVVDLLNELNDENNELRQELNRMNENKRFNLLYSTDNYGLIVDNEKKIDNIMVGNEYQKSGLINIVDLLNNLSEENVKLKSEIKDLNDILARYEEKELQMNE